MAKEILHNEEEILLSDSDSSLSDICCETCGINFASFKDYASHVEGRKHRKKAKEATLRSKCLTDARERTGSRSGDEDDESNEIYCEVCDKHISGYISYAAHIKGSVHAKRVKKQELKRQVSDMPGVLNKVSKENGSEDEESLQQPFARCSTCQKEFSGPEPFQLHMKSAMHKKKEKQLEVQQILLSKYEALFENMDDFSECTVCQKTFSGVVSYHVHMQSAAHKRNLEKKKVAEEIKQFCSSGDSKVGYACKECEKIFKDPLSFKSHLESNSHEKRKAKIAMTEFLSSYPEIVYSTPFEEEGSDSKYYLICKLCNVSFTGPESAQDHVKSHKHITMKEDRRLRKLLRMQKKNP